MDLGGRKGGIVIVVEKFGGFVLVEMVNWVGVN